MSDITSEAPMANEDLTIQNMKERIYTRTSRTTGKTSNTHSALYDNSHTVRVR